MRERARRGLFLDARGKNQNLEKNNCTARRTAERARAHRSSPTLFTMALLSCGAPARLLRDGVALTSRILPANRARGGGARLLCQATSTEKDVMRGVSADHKEVVARVADLAESASDRWTCNVSPFLEPPALADALMVSSWCYFAAFCAGAPPSSVEVSQAEGSNPLQPPTDDSPTCPSHHDPHPTGCWAHGGG